MRACSNLFTGISAALERSPGIDVFVYINSVAHLLGADMRIHIQLFQKRAVLSPHHLKIDPSEPDGLHKLSVFWPFLLENIRPLQLVVWGRVMRANGDGTAVKIHRHEFRIRAINGSAELMPMIRGQSSGP